MPLLCIFRVWRDLCSEPSLWAHWSAAFSPQPKPGREPNPAAHTHSASTFAQLLQGGWRSALGWAVLCCGAVRWAVLYCEVDGVAAWCGRPTGLNSATLSASWSPALRARRPMGTARPTPLPALRAGCPTCSPAACLPRTPGAPPAPQRRSSVLAPFRTGRVAVRGAPAWLPEGAACHAHHGCAARLRAAGQPGQGRPQGQPEQAGEQAGGPQAAGQCYPSHPLGRVAPCSVDQVCEAVLAVAPCAIVCVSHAAPRLGPRKAARRAVQWGCQVTPTCSSCSVMSTHTRGHVLTGAVLAGGQKHCKQGHCQAQGKGRLATA